MNTRLKVPADQQDRQAFARRIIAARLEVAEEKVTLEADLIKELGGCELRVLEVICDFEEAFGDLPHDVAEQIRTVGDLLRSAGLVAAPALHLDEAA